VAHHGQAAAVNTIRGGDASKLSGVDQGLAAPKKAAGARQISSCGRIGLLSVA
jgi:hypothetical protein